MYTLNGWIRSSLKISDVLIIIIIIIKYNWYLFCGIKDNSVSLSRSRLQVISVFERTYLKAILHHADEVISVAAKNLSNQNYNGIMYSMEPQALCRPGFININIKGSLTDKLILFTRNVLKFSICHGLIRISHVSHCKTYLIKSG